MPSPCGRLAPRRIGAAARGARRAAVLACAVAALGGCQVLGTYMPVVEQFGVYKLDVNQGNYIAQDQVDRLKVGQNRAQVRAILGTPLVASVFRPDQWDYVYEFKRQGRAMEHRYLAVYFVDDKLARWEGDEMPQSMAALNRAASAKSLPPEPSSSDRGFFAWFWDLFPK
jgi:outer membrane protein assembly factor BamE